MLLTDGANNRGIEPLDAVPYAVERRVRVYPIGFGTDNPAPPSCTREQLGGDVFDAGGFGGGGGGFGGGFGGRRRSLVADEPTLKEVARQTGGTYHGAKDADQLRKVFADLPKEVATQKQPHRDHLDLRGARRPPRGRGSRGLDALEPVPVASARRRCACLLRGAGNRAADRHPRYLALHGNRPVRILLPGGSVGLSFETRPVRLRGETGVIAATRVK